MNKALLLIMLSQPCLSYTADPEQSSLCSSQEVAQKEELASLLHVIQTYLKPIDTDLMKSIAADIERTLNQEHITSYFCEHGTAYVNAKQKFTLLHLAAKHNAPTLAALLLADTHFPHNQKDSNGKTALHYAAAFIPEHKECELDAHYHITPENVALAAFLPAIEQKKVDPNIQDNEGNTALHLLRNLSFLAPLIMNGACKYKRNTQGRIPMEAHTLRMTSVPKEVHWLFAEIMCPCNHTASHS